VLFALDYHSIVYNLGTVTVIMSFHSKSVIKEAYYS